MNIVGKCGKGANGRDHKGFSKGEVKGINKGKGKASMGLGAQTWKGGSGQGMKGKGKSKGAYEYGPFGKGFVERQLPAEGSLGTQVHELHG